MQLQMCGWAQDRWVVDGAVGPVEVRFSSLHFFCRIRKKQRKSEEVQGGVVKQRRGRCEVVIYKEEGRAGKRNVAQLLGSFSGLRVEFINLKWSCVLFFSHFKLCR